MVLELGLEWVSGLKGLVLVLTLVMFRRPAVAFVGASRNKNNVESKTVVSKLGLDFGLGFGLGLGFGFGLS